MKICCDCDNYDVVKIDIYGSECGLRFNMLVICMVYASLVVNWVSWCGWRWFSVESKSPNQSVTSGQRPTIRHWLKTAGVVISHRR